MSSQTDTTPDGWLGFELSVLRRLKFRSVALPFAGEPDLGLYLKRWGVRVAANDTAQWAWTKGVACVENNAERLSGEEVEALVEDLYVPGEKMSNPALTRWFNETDAWWFDNLRVNAERLTSATARALALTLGMMVGDYVLSFDAETRGLREPLALSMVFRRLWQSFPPPVNNSQRNTCASVETRRFVAEQHTDMLFLRLPGNLRGRRPVRNSPLSWREEWVRGGDDFWDEFERGRAGGLGSSVETKQQYLSLVEDLLRTAAHLPAWAVACVEDGFISSADLTEIVNRVRKVEHIYTKDFSELMGVRAVIITA
ncbi:MAG TPA: hypothetical protein VF507_01245 [Pyrinomonadaceae bacterium]